MAAFDKRIRCAIGSGGSANAPSLTNKMKVNPILLKRVPYLVGAETYDEALELFDIDIETAPPMDRPLLIFHSTSYKLIDKLKIRMPHLSNISHPFNMEREKEGRNYDENK